MALTSNCRPSVGSSGSKQGARWGGGALGPRDCPRAAHLQGRVCSQRTRCPRHPGRLTPVRMGTPGPCRGPLLPQSSRSSSSAYPPPFSSFSKSSVPLGVLNPTLQGHGDSPPSFLRRCCWELSVLLLSAKRPLKVTSVPTRAPLNGKDCTRAKESLSLGSRGVWGQQGEVLWDGRPWSPVCRSDLRPVHCPGTGEGRGFPYGSNLPLQHSPTCLQ